MATVNLRTQSSRQPVTQAQPQAQKGWLGRAVGAIREAFSVPTVSTQGARRGPDGYERGARIDINRPRQLNAMNSGRGADNSRGLQRINVPDDALLPFLKDMSDGKYS